MKIEIKNLQYFPELSDERWAFTAALFIDGKCAGHCMNRGEGSETFIEPLNKQGAALIAQAKDYYEKSPAPTTPPEQAAPPLPSGSLLRQINDLVAQEIQRMETKKMQKQIGRVLRKYQHSAVVYGKIDGLIRYLTLDRPVQEMIGHPEQRQKLVSLIRNEVLPQLRKDDRILNTNIPFALYQKAGLTFNQFAQRSSQLNRKRNTKGKGI
jgi:hypothetical protein